MTEHVRALTGIRGLCCVAVALQHYWENLAIPWIFRQQGTISVTMFFALSGYLMSYVYASCGNFESKKCRTIFWKKRFARIAPLYYLGMILLCKDAWAVFQRDFNGDLYHQIMCYIQLVATPFGLQSLTFYPSVWFGVGWSLSVEMVAYVVFPYVRLNAAWFTLCVLMSVYLLPMSLMLASEWWALVFFSQSAFRIWEFLIAALVSKLVIFGNWSLPRYTTDIVPLVWIVTIMQVPYLDPQIWKWFYHGWLGWMSVFVVMSIKDSRSWFGKFLSLRPIVWMGEISFSAYVLHEFIHSYIMPLFDHSDPSIAMHSLYLAMYLIIIGLSGHLCHKYFEIPSYKWLAQRLTRGEKCGCAEEKASLSSLLILNTDETCHEGSASVIELTVDSWIDRSAL